MIEQIKAHNALYYDEASEQIWKSRTILTIDGVRVPQYIYKGTVSPKDHSTQIYHYIKSHAEDYKGKKFLDIGCCAGINNLLLTRDGFEVIGIDNTIYSLNASLYAMNLNDLYYKVYLGDENLIEQMDYDVLIVNQMGYIEGFMESVNQIIAREKLRGRRSLVLV